MLEYILQFILGGTIVAFLYHFSKIKNNKLCAILPAIPGFSLLGLYYTYLHKGNLNNYMYNLCIYILVTLSCLIVVYTLNIKLNKIKYALMGAFIIWVCLLMLVQPLLRS